ncbi:MAG: cupin domain-containing protein [Woeseiaceae bacterium]|nr:cupin domain-containing protein [Woeseiaceae bacterium]
MSRKRSNSGTDKAGEDAIFELISESIAAPPADARRVDRLRTRVMSQLGFDTIRRGDGEWREIMPQVYKKTLQVDEARGIESFLLRMEAGGRIPAHDHESDELCCVIEGDLAFGELQLRQGDYHFAHQGSRHLDATTEHGCLLFLQCGIAGEYHVG